MTTQKYTAGTLSWVDVTDPALHDMAGLRRAFPQFSELNLEDVLSHIERPKIDVHDDYVFIVMLFPLWDAHTRLTRASEVDFFIGRDFIVTVHDGKLKPLFELARRCEQSAEHKAKLLERGTAHLFYLMLDSLVDYLFPILDKINAKVHDIEERLFEPEREINLIRDIAFIRRDAIAVRRVIRLNVPILQQTETKLRSHFPDGLEDYFDDVVDHAQKARDVMDETVEIITALSGTADSLLTHRLNNVIRILTIFSVIILPLTLIAGIYGMNVALPMDENPDAFWIILLLMGGISAAMLAYFRVRHWL
jgi:magnesium transporter